MKNTKRKIKRRKWIHQVYCHSCNNWLSKEDVGFINLSKGRQGENVLTFKCLCGAEQKCAIFGRCSPPTRRKE